MIHLQWDLGRGSFWFAHAGFTMEWEMFWITWTPIVLEKGIGRSSYISWGCDIYEVTAGIMPRQYIDAYESNNSILYTPLLGSYHISE